MQRRNRPGGHAATSFGHVHTSWAGQSLNRHDLQISQKFSVNLCSRDGENPYVGSQPVTESPAPWK